MKIVPTYLKAFSTYNWEFVIFTAANAKADTFSYGRLSTFFVEYVIRILKVKNKAFRPLKFKNHFRFFALLEGKTIYLLI